LIVYRQLSYIPPLPILAFKGRDATTIMKRKTRNFAGLVLRMSVCAGLLVYLFAKTDRNSLSDAISQACLHWPWLVLGLILTFLGLLSGGIRWGRILAFHGFQFRTRKVLHMFFVGQFFNSFMLGACGGDLVRAYYTWKDQPGRRTAAAMTVVMDRAIGLFATILFSCIMIFARINVFLDNEGPLDTGIVMLTFLVATAAGLFVLFRQNVFEHFRLFRWLENSTRIGPLIRKAYEIFFLYRKDRRVLLPALGLSLFNLVLLTLACCCFGHALNLKVSAIDYFALFPIITVLTAVPITPGSLGVRETLFVSLFSAVFVDRPHAILLSLMVYIGGAFWSLFGGILYITVSSREERRLPATLETANLLDNS